MLKVKRLSSSSSQRNCQKQASTLLNIGVLVQKGIPILYFLTVPLITRYYINLILITEKQGNLDVNERGN